ncbi:MAG: hypothetical protein IS860_07850 [Nitrosopumilus sp.]|nr:hypothetical protein [Nitrosopumilus sp.]
MNKASSIFLTSVITAILLSSAVTATTDAFTFQKITWTMKAPATCLTSTGESCGDGKIRDRFILEASQDDISTGMGKAKISFKGTSGESAGKTLNLKTNNIIFQNDVANEIVTFTGTSSDKNGNLWNVSGTLENF